MTLSATTSSVPPRDQLAHLDQLVASHETYWAAVAQQNPRSTIMTAFLRQHWDPWFMRWMQTRPTIERQGEEAVASFVHEAAQGLSGVRELAAYNLIPTPDLGTTQHGFLHGDPPHVAGTPEGERSMTAYGYNQVGADQSYPQIAAHAVMSAAQQNPSPVYGYHRAGSQQKIYLFHTLDQGRGWFAALTNEQQPYDYAAVFVASDLSRPVPELESFGHTTVSGDAQVGNVLPFLLGLPFGGAAGYYLRKWQEDNPGRALPLVPPGKLPAPHVPSAHASGYPHVGGPWLDIDGGGYGSPYVGASQSSHYGTTREHRHAVDPDAARRRSFPQTQALIQSASREVLDAHDQAQAQAYVWSLDPPGPSYTPGVELTGTTTIVPFSSHAAALDYMRERIQTPHVAIALFDTQSRWPNPTNWTKEDDASYEPYIAQQIAKSTTRTAGIGAWGTAIGNALDDLRSRAQSLADRRAGNVIGVVHTAKDGLWHTLAFHSVDDADDWFGTATHDPAAFMYAAYFDKSDYTWPHPLHEQIGGGMALSSHGGLSS